MAANNKLSYKDVIKLLAEIDEINSNRKVQNILIIGGASLMLRNLNVRETTADIDCFQLFLEDPTYIKKITSVIKNDQYLAKYINSAALVVVEEVFQYINEYEEIMKGDFSNIRIFLPTIETFVVLKILSYHDSRINDNRPTRDRDLDDITIHELVKNLDLEIVYNLLEKTISKKYSNRYYQYEINDFEDIIEKIREAMIQ